MKTYATIFRLGYPGVYFLALTALLSVFVGGTEAVRAVEANIPKSSRPVPRRLSAIPVIPTFPVIDEDRSEAGQTGEWSARRLSNRIQIHFRTFEERGSVGFDLYRETASGWVRVNQERIPARAPVSGSSYVVEDWELNEEGPRHYRLMEVNIRARNHLVADVRLEPVTIPVPAIQPVLPSRRSLMAQTIRDDRITERRFAAETTRLISPTPGESSGKNLIQIVVNKRGVHRVTDFDVATAAARNLFEVRQWFLTGAVGLHYLGQPLTYLPSADGTSIFFYVPLETSLDTSVGHVWMSGSANQPLAGVSGGSPAAGIPGNYTEIQDEERDAIPELVLPAISTEPMPDYWMWNFMLAESSTVNKRSFGFSVSDVVQEAGELRLRLFGGTDNEHRVEVRLNGTELGRVDFARLVEREAVFSIPSGVLLNNNNTLETTAFLRDPNSTFLTSKVWVDGFSVRYRRRMLAGPDGIGDVVVDSARSVTIGNLSGTIRVMDTTQPRNPRWVTQVTESVVGDGNSQVTFNASAGRYTAFSETRAHRPISLKKVRIRGLHDRKHKADYLLVAPAGLERVAQPLVDYRRNQGLVTMIVTTEEIAVEFGNGVLSPSAVKAFLHYCHDEWARGPAYVVLMGDGTYDNRNILEKGDNAIPTILTATGEGLFANDKVYAEVRGPGRMAFAIGRLPVLTEIEANRVIRKATAFESSGIDRAIVMNDKDDAGGLFTTIGTQLATQLNARIPTDQLYSPSPDAMRSLLFARLGSGLGLLNYVGHGSPRGFGRTPFYLSREDVPGLSSPFPTLMFAMTCVVGQFEIPGIPCVGEELVTRTDGGAVAVYAPSGLGFLFDTSVLNEKIIQALPASGSTRLGDIINQAIEAFRIERNTTVYGNFNLIGDPALQVRLNKAR